MDLDAIMNSLILYERAGQRVPDDVVETVSTISKIAGTTPRSIQNILLLLILPVKISDAVKTGAVLVSQVYTLAANLENSRLMIVFESILANPVANKRLTELLNKAAQTDTAPPGEAPSPFQSVYTAGETLTNRLLDEKVRYDLIELEDLILFFLSVIEVIKHHLVSMHFPFFPQPL